jgi:DNA-binding transcriptional LysR family regulator
MGRRAVSSLANIDLNLLVILRELLREQNVTRAAQRVGVTQPAASAALARLRRHFDDDLLERTRGGFVLSPLGQQLAGQIEPLCLGLERLFSPEPTFRPAESDREFTLMTTDYVLSAFGEQLSRALHEAAPAVRLHVEVVKGALPTDLPETLRRVDGIISAPKAEFKVAEISSQELFRDRWVCVVDADNAVGDDITIADLERMPWVIPNHPDGEYPASSPLGPLLAKLGNRPNVVVRVDSYQATPYFVAGTDRVAVMQHRLARRFADRPDLRILECPGAPPPLVEILWWHQRQDDEGGHAWFRSLLARAARPLQEVESTIHATYAEHSES